MPRRPERVRFTRFHVVLLVLALSAWLADDPARWDRGYLWLAHAPWDGALAGDLITPAFLFFLGAAIPMSATAPAALAAIAAALIGAGLAFSGISRPELATWRVTGVFQRAGVALALGTAAHRAAAGDYRRRAALLGSLAVFITLTYWLVMAHVRPPGGVPGDLSRAGNLAAWVDRAVLGRHAWSDEWDPDGLLSTLASVSTLLAGMVIGIVAAARWQGRRTVVQFVGGGVAAIIGGVLSTYAVPMNRTLWSGSFVLASAGAATILFTAVVWSQRRK
jgi:predicted acyltransferase